MGELRNRSQHIHLFPRILVVDDEPRVRRFLSHRFPHELFVVECAEDGAAALDRIRNADPPIDAIVLDLSMPVMDGFEVLTEITKIDDSIPVVVLSARNAEEEKVRALDLGAAEYITKPFSVPVLARRLRWHLLRSTDPSMNASKTDERSKQE